MDEILTSVKVNKEIFDTFKMECIKRKLSINQLENGAMDLYLNSEEFRKQVTNHNK